MAIGIGTLYSAIDTGYDRGLAASGSQWSKGYTSRRILKMGGHSNGCDGCMTLAAMNRTIDTCRRGQVALVDTATGCDAGYAGGIDIIGARSNGSARERGEPCGL